MIVEKKDFQLWEILGVVVGIAAVMVPVLLLFITNPREMALVLSCKCSVLREEALKAAESNTAAPTGSNSPSNTV